MGKSFEFWWENVGKSFEDTLTVKDIVEMAYEYAKTDLRDKFAIAALQGRISNPRCDWTPMTFARDAYALADAMLKVRER